MDRRKEYRIHFRGALLGTLQTPIKRQQVVYGDTFEEAVLNIKEKYLVLEVFS